MAKALTESGNEIASLTLSARAKGRLPIKTTGLANGENYGGGTPLGV